MQAETIKKRQPFFLYSLIRKKDHAMLNQVVHDIYTIYLFPYSRIRSELTKLTTSIRDSHFDITTLNSNMLIHLMHPNPCLFKGHDCHPLASEDE
jgi:hypothetical protein